MGNPDVSNAQVVVTQPDQLEQIVREHLQVQNDLEYELSDKLDNKMNIALVVITFLGTQSGAFITFAGMPRHWHNLQIASILCVALASVSAVWGLLPRNYKVGLSPDDFIPLG